MDNRRIELEALITDREYIITQRQTMITTNTDRDNSNETMAYGEEHFSALEGELLTIAQKIRDLK
jgi:hypothetical protein